MDGWEPRAPLACRKPGESTSRADEGPLFSFFASARSLQIGDGVTVIAVTSVGANLSTILAGLAVFGDRIGSNALEVGVRLAAFVLILIGAALIPAPVRAGEALEESAVETESSSASPARAEHPARGHPIESSSG